jgi:uncharacterized membrane protein YphA (DoxX/SURF4 family)
MRRTDLERAVSFLARFIVAATFLFAATSKIRDPIAFAEQTGNYQFLPELSSFVAITIPSIELVAALVLVLGRGYWRQAAAVVLFGLLLVFTTAIARAWAMGINLECGCFGSGSSHIGPIPIVRNVSLVAALVLSHWLDRRALAAAPSTP